MSEETKTVGDVLEDFVRGKPKWEAVSRAYHAVFDNLDPDKRARLEIMQGFYRSARSAYTEIRICGNGDPARLIYAVGGYARNALHNFDRISELYATDESGTVQLLQKTSDWLESKGWPGLPYVERNGAEVPKSAAEVRADMLRYAKLRADLEAADNSVANNPDSLESRLRKVAVA